MNKHIPELDGLRAFAILLVLASHTSQITESVSAAKMGWIGVDLFFVLSGFLITGILLDTSEQPRYLQNFYVRRSLRIWPLYYGLVLFVYLIGPHLGQNLQLNEYAFDKHIYHWQYYALYLQNLLLKDLGPFPLAITWSLAIEEHFYLAWPLLVRFWPRRFLPYLLIGIILFAITFRVLAFHVFGQPPFFIYTFTLCRIDGLAWGALVAWYIRSQAFSEVWFRRLAICGLMIAFSAFATLKANMQANDSMKAASLVWIYSLLAAGFAGILGLALSWKETAVGTFLRFPLMTYTGKISYGLYILHPIIFSYCAKEKYPIALEYILLFGIASVSWFAAERPILSLKERFAAR